jgi:hypothetical protein
MAIGTYGDAGRLDEVEVIAIPKIGSTIRHVPMSG